MSKASKSTATTKHVEPPSEIVDSIEDKSSTADDTPAPAPTKSVGRLVTASSSDEDGEDTKPKAAVKKADAKKVIKESSSSSDETISLPKNAKGAPAKKTTPPPKDVKKTSDSSDNDDEPSSKPTKKEIAPKKEIEASDEAIAPPKKAAPPSKGSVPAKSVAPKKNDKEDSDEDAIPPPIKNVAPRKGAAISKLASKIKKVSASNSDEDAVPPPKASSKVAKKTDSSSDEDASSKSTPKKGINGKKRSSEEDSSKSVESSDSTDSGGEAADDNIPKLKSHLEQISIDAVEKMMGVVKEHLRVWLEDNGVREVLKKAKMEPSELMEEILEKPAPKRTKAAAVTTSKYTEEELKAMAKPNSDGWKEKNKGEYCIMYFGARPRKGKKPHSICNTSTVKAKWVCDEDLKTEAGKILLAQTKVKGFDKDKHHNKKVSTRRTFLNKELKKLGVKTSGKVTSTKKKERSDDDSEEESSSAPDESDEPYDDYPFELDGYDGDLKYDPDNYLIMHKTDDGYVAIGIDKEKDGEEIKKINEEQVKKLQKLRISVDKKAMTKDCRKKIEAHEAEQAKLRKGDSKRKEIAPTKRPGARK